MRAGLRLQILLLLGGLFLLAFVPLFLAVATYASFTLRQVREAHAQALGRAVAGHVSEARAHRSPEQLLALLGAEIGSQGVAAIGVYGVDGLPLARAGEPFIVDLLPARVAAGRERVTELSKNAALEVVVPGADGAVAAILRTDDSAARAAPLVRLLGLYSLLVGLVLLVAAYFALTRLIVRPLDDLARAAERVATGARRFSVPERGARELTELGRNLHTMTEHLIREEEALRAKVDEVERATVSLREAQDRLIRSERLASVGRLAAGLAHEVGNPIAALLGFEDLLLEGGLEPAEQRDFLQRMRKETERINGILRDLLQFARPGEQQQMLGAAHGDVAAAVNDTAALVAPQKAMRDVTLDLSIPEGLPSVALSDEQLMQLVLNLVLNAVDALDGGGRVHVTALSSASGGVQLVVEDNGPGVVASVRDRLFEPFVTTKEVGKGTGLGLAVCRGLVEAVGGSIALDLTFSGGARFVVELPGSTPPG
ncbi:MAG TPA: HAMP domain-containing sensor histidine kinase [Polyangiaceae bacterium]|nr:HAMP domain-containing sensor histidine kinase [Polyangiaceae bacterium]